MAVPLKFGPSNLLTTEFGTGPGGDTGSPKWTATMFTPSASTIVAALATASSNSMRVFLNLAGARGTWCDKNAAGDYIFNWTKYETQVRRWTVAGGASGAVATAITNAFTSGDALAFVVDEPQHHDFAGTITPEIANNMGLLFKDIWTAGVLCCIRMDSTKLNLFGSPGASGWTGFDYGIAQYESQPTVTGETFAQYFNTQKTGLATLNMGMVPSMNMIDGGLKNTAIDGIDPCWACGPSGASGVLKGSYTGTAPDATFYPCGTAPNGENRFWPNPAWLMRFADVVKTDLDAPAVIGFSAWSTPETRTNWLALANGATMAAAYDYMITTLATRASFTGLRTPKGVAAPTTTVGITRVGSSGAAATSVTPPAHVAGDLLVFTAICSSAATVPSLPAGKTNIQTASGNLVGIRKGYLKAASAAEVSGTWSNATAVFCDVYRGVDPADPIGAISTGAFNNTTIAYDDLTMEVTDATSWVHAGAVHGTATNIATTVPTGMINRGNTGQGATFDTNGGVASWIERDVTVNASGGSRALMCELRADPAGVAPTTNNPPVLTAITDKTVEEQALLSFSASATDPDVGHVVHYFLLPGTTPVPATAAINLTTGAFTWTPGTTDVGTHNIRVRAVDITGTNPPNLFDEVSFTITVTEIPGNEVPPGEDTTPDVLSAFTGGLVSIT